MKTVTVYHPTLPTSQDVPTDKVDEWVEQGWRKTQPKEFADAPAAGTDEKGSNA